MLYFTGLLIYILISYFLSKKIKDDVKSKKMFVFISCIGVVIFQGFRAFNVGTDLKTYISAFSEIGETTFENLMFQNFEPGYVILNKILYKIGINERQFLIIIASIIQIPIFITIYKYSENPLISILWYFSFGNFIMTFSGLRQSIAMSLCFAAYQFIKNKNLFKFFFTIIFATIFHKSAMFCLILYPIYYLRINSIGYILSLLFLSLMFILKKQIFELLVGLYYGKKEEIVSTGAYTMFIVYLCLYIISFYNKNPDFDYKALRNILFLLVMVYSFSSLHYYITRIGFPLTLYMSIFIPKFINSFNIREKRMVYSTCCLILILCFYSFVGGLNTLPFSFG